MHPAIPLASLALLSAVAFGAPRKAHAETYQTCSGFIDSVPATITTQGTWCLRKDLGTGMASGAAITIAANNVTIDCNDFKLGGLAAGNGTLAIGILASNRDNATVRHCKVRGFLHGTHLAGSGHAVLDSRFDNNTYRGISIGGDGSVVRGNRVSDTGGSTNVAYPNAVGIYFDVGHAGTVLDNFVQGVYATPGNGGWVYGIRALLTTGDVARNTVAVLQPDVGGQVRAIAITAADTQVVVRDNVVAGGNSTPVSGIGVGCWDTGVARDNTVSGVANGMLNCVDGGGNVAN